MTRDIEHAFAHPEERAATSGDGVLHDRISLRDYVVAVDIGAYQKERGHRQHVRFNVVVEVRRATAPLEDDVDRILSYDRITEAIAAELAAERLNLLETLAERVADRILAAPQALRVFVRIEKLDIGPYALGVEIERSRTDGPLRRAGDESLHPVVIHLGNAAIGSPDLAALLDQWQAAGKPLILTVGLPDLPRPATGHPPTQRRIDLLAMEQNAWALAARDPRCVVVATRTEMDWAMRRGQMVVWAPSKLVLDAVASPTSREPLALALWLARLIGAQNVIVHDKATLASGTVVPVGAA